MHRRRPVVAPVAVAAASFASGHTPGVASLSRPGGNVTGVSLLGQEIIPKTLSQLREVLPKLRRIDLLGLGSAVNPPNDYWAWRCGTLRRGAGPLPAGVRLVIAAVMRGASAWPAPPPAARAH